MSQTIILCCKMSFVLTDFKQCVHFSVQFREGNLPGDNKQITYCELLKEVCKFANVLKDKGRDYNYNFRLT